LNQLADAGIIKRIQMSDGVYRFDREELIYNHFYCNKCNKIHDIPSEHFKDIARIVKDKTGYDLDVYNTMFVGTCKNCQKE